MSMYITFIELSLLSHNVKGKLHTLSNVINPSDKQKPICLFLTTSKAPKHLKQSNRKHEARPKVNP